MTDTNNPQPAPLDVRPVKRPLWQRVSVVWFVPILALIVSLAVAYSNYTNQGTLIEISFENASGVAADETVIKYRDVTVGRVEKMAFAEGLSDLLVYARIDKTVAPYLDDDAQFWVVSPDVSVRGISGLDTVLGGVYIQGTWDTEADVAQTEFVGLEDAPLNSSRQRGTVINLRAPDGSALAEGAPILHKGIEVGNLETPELSFNGEDVIVEAFIKYPYDQRITSNTRFWDTSGFSLRLGTGGVSLDVNSIASLIEGGIAYETVVSGGRPVRDGQIFELFGDEDAARSSALSNSTLDTDLLNVAVLFDGSVRGLTVGSDVRFQGIRIGKVTDLSAFVVQTQQEQAVRLRTSLAIEPSRLGLGDNTSVEEAQLFIEKLVLDGLRARMITGNILSGALQVELTQVADAAPVVIEADTDGRLILPITQSEITDVAASAEGVLARINDLPVEDLMNGAITMMDSFRRLADNEDILAVPSSVSALLDEARALVGGEDMQAIPADLRGAVAEISETVTQMNTALAGANEAEIIKGLATTIDTVNTTVGYIEEATRNLPAITARIEDLTNKLLDVEVQSMVDQATETLTSIDALIGSDTTADLPASVSAALDELRLFLGEVREGGAVENVNTALASASAAAQALETSVQGLPALSERATRLIAESQTLIDQTEDLIQSYGDRSRFNAETLGTLRDIQAAADAVTNLARTIQRNPSSLLTGR